MAVPAPGPIFVSYRRQDTSGTAGRLTDRLIARFGADQVFIDVNSIGPGLDFRDEIERAVAACGVLLAVIGPRWVSVTGEDGRRRLEDPDDVVRLEVEAALKRNVRVVPVLVEGAAMPKRQDLPESLATLARRNALTVRHESFSGDVGRLLGALEQATRAVQPPGSPAGLGLEDLATVPPEVLTVGHAGASTGWRSVPTGACWPPPAMTARRGCGRCSRPRNSAPRQWHCLPLLERPTVLSR